MQLTAITALNRINTPAFGTTFKVDLGGDPDGRRAKLDELKKQLRKYDTEGLIVVPATPVKVKPGTPFVMPQDYLIITHPSPKLVEQGHTTEDYDQAKPLMSSANRANADPADKSKWARFVQSLAASATAYPPTEGTDLVIAKMVEPVKKAASGKPAAKSKLVAKKVVVAKPALKKSVAKASTPAKATKPSALKIASGTESSESRSTNRGKRVKSPGLNRRGFQVVDPTNGNENVN